MVPEIPCRPLRAGVNNAWDFGRPEPTTCYSLRLEVPMSITQRIEGWNKYLSAIVRSLEVENKQLKTRIRELESQQICEIKQTRIVAVQDVRTLRFHRL